MIWIANYCNIWVAQWYSRLMVTFMVSRSGQHPTYQWYIDSFLILFMVTSVCISKSVWEILLLKFMITGHKMSLCSWLVEPHMKNHLLFISWIKTTLALGLFWVEQPFTIQAVFSKMSSKQCKVSQDVTHAWGICELPVPLHYNVCIYSSNQFCNMISSWVIIKISLCFPVW